jgi:hypothetical protein
LFSPFNVLKAGIDIYNACMSTQSSMEISIFFLKKTS